MLVDACEEKGIELMLNTKGTSLITDDTGAVVGAVAETEDSIITFHAGSVILATGGISQNEELVEKYSPKLTRAGLIPTSAVSHTGDGFLMALEVGGRHLDVFATPLFSTVVDPDLSALTDTSAPDHLRPAGRERQRRPLRQRGHQHGLGFHGLHCLRHDSGWQRALLVHL